MSAQNIATTNFYTFNKCCYVLEPPVKAHAAAADDMTENQPKQPNPPNQEIRYDNFKQEENASKRTKFNNYKMDITPISLQF
jgi:hypothetical protein